ncbi:MAG: hypothetical protein LBR42_04945 [Candidatus Methanoplasma sp.]|jgi:fluoride ion exporter CrcB/FEX|nr:hypothetical protein [Candidatus Methanoplasma sp.]
MSFFDDNGKVGLALMIIGIIGLIVAVASIVIAFTDDTVNTGATVANAIGGLIFGILIFLFGQNVRGGSNDKVGIVSGLVRVIGVATILSAIFVAISSWLASNSIGTGIVTAIVNIIIGLILLWIAAKIAGQSKNVISNVIWVLLVIISLVLAILSLIGIFAIFAGNIVGGIQSLCWFFVYVYLFIAALSPEVKSAMGI